jgi:death-on-curing protein
MCATTRCSNRRSRVRSSCTRTAIPSRTSAAVACETFLELNGARLDASDLELYPVYMALAEGRLAERDFAAWLRERVRPGTRGDAHERRAADRVKPRTAPKRRVRAAAAR